VIRADEKDVECLVSEASLCEMGDLNVDAGSNSWMSLSELPNFDLFSVKV
jgi:hypothetical protein